MRYLIQFLIPALIFVAVVYLLTRGRRQDSAEATAAGPKSDAGAFIAILVVSAIVALATAYALVTLWE